MSIGNYSMLCNYTMSLGNHTISITRVQEECELGVLFSSNFKFDKHISNTVLTANNLIGIKEHLVVWINVYSEHCIPP